MKNGYQLEANYLCEVVHTAPLAVELICLRCVPEMRVCLCVITTTLRLTEGECGERGESAERAGPALYLSSKNSKANSRNQC
jgi:hypothetical protein